MDNLKICDRCGSDACYVQEVNDKIKNYMCYLIWMPNTINIPDKGMVFADGTRASNWSWAAVKAIPMPEEEKKQFAEKGKDYEWKMDMENIKHFEESDFIEALDYIGVFEK